MVPTGSTRLDEEGELHIDVHLLGVKVKMGQIVIIGVLGDWSRRRLALPEGKQDRYTNWDGLIKAELK